MMQTRFTSVTAALLAAAMLAACGGGGSYAPAAPSSNATTPGNPTAQSLGVTFAGTQTLAQARAVRDLSSTPVTVTVNGTVVGTGTLDGGGRAKIRFTVAVPAGTTITIVAGRLTATATLAMSTHDTAVLVTVKPDGTISVVSAADRDGSGTVNPNEQDRDDEDEDGRGNPTSVTASGNALPANAPFTLTNACGVLTLTPVGTAAASIAFEEKGSDGESDESGRVRFEGAFTSALHFPVVAGAARLHIQIFDAQHNRLIEVKAPVSAFTSGAANASPCPSPSATPSSAPATPEPSETPHASPSPSAAPSAIPHS